MTLKLSAFALSTAFTVAAPAAAATFDQAPAATQAAVAAQSLRAARRSDQAAAQPVLPPASSEPVFTTIELSFQPINESIIEPQTYLYYIQSKDLD